MTSIELFTCPLPCLLATDYSLYGTWAAQVVSNKFIFKGGQILRLDR